MNSFPVVQHWSPCEEFFTQYKKKDYAVLILNTPINFNFNQHFIIDLWNHAKVRVTVDGGTKKWLRWLTGNEREFKEVLQPDLITGDMDSLPKEVLGCFQNGGTKIIVTPDQDETDYTKALRELKLHCNSENVDTIYVLADTCGRFDQIMANINTLYKSRDILTDTKVYQVASTSITWLLSKGRHSISVPVVLRDSQEWCALIPIGGPCVVTSTGLKWNLDNRKLEFGVLVSTSNTYDGSPVVTIETDAPLVWSMGIQTLL